MRHHILLALTLGAAIGFSACNSGDDGGGSTAPPVQTLTGGTITGTVTDPSGARLANVAVRTGSGANARSTSTNEQGFFALVNVSAGTPVVSFRLGGYADNMKAIPVEAGRNTQLTVALCELGAQQQVDVTQAVTVAHRNGSVLLPANGVVDGNGQPVANAVVGVTTMIAGDPNYVETFPGEFVGTDPNGTGPLVSLGVVDVTLADATGDPLQLASGQSATIELPIPPPAHDPGDATVPLWYLDPVTATWIQEGTATRDAGAGVYRGTVTHFTPWNFDIRPPNSFKRIRLTFNGVPVVGTSLRIDSGSWSAGDVTNGNGEVLLNVPANRTGTVRMLGSDGNWITLRANETMAGPGQTILNVYTEADGVLPQIATVILTWGAMPSDLDSHMTVPTPGGRTHVYYSSMGNLSDLPYCALNTDDVTSFGPEIITVTRALTGTYRYTVHNYSTNAQHPITQSGARVILITRDRGGRVYNVPSQNPNNENYWAVFDLVFDAAGGLTIQDVNQFGGTSILNP